MSETPQKRARATGPSKAVDKPQDGALDAALGSEEARQLLGILAQLIAFDLAERQRLDALREAAEARAAAEAAASEREQKEREDKDVFRKREDFINQCDLGLGSLVGSWFHRLENGEIVWQGCVVAEPQPGAYLVELHNWQDGASAHQRIVTIADIADKDSGYEWRFYDSDEWMRMAGDRSPAWEAEREHA